MKHTASRVMATMSISLSFLSFVAFLWERITPNQTIIYSLYAITVMLLSIQLALIGGEQ